MTSRLRTTPDPRNCDVIRGVEFWVAYQGDSDLFRAVIAAEALQERYGAGDSAESWLEAFFRHRETIERQARLAFQKSGGLPFVAISVVVQSPEG